MIKSLRLRNFGPYESASVTFEGFTTILGPNGAGKSLLFVALRAVGRIARFPLRYGKAGASLGGYPTRTGQVSIGEILHRGDTARTLTLAVEVESPKMSGRYEVHLKDYTNPAGVIVAETLAVNTPKGEFEIVARDDGSVENPSTVPNTRLQTPRFFSIPLTLFHSKDLEESKLGQELQEALWDRIRVIRFDPSALKAPADIGKHELAPTGHNFPTFLDQIRNEAGGKAEFEALLARFRTVCPHVEDILLPLVEDLGGTTARKRLQMISNSVKVPAELESDGNVLLLAYTSLLHGTRSHDTICIEEPENGVHPSVIPRQVAMLRELTQKHGDNPPAQVLVCTHSRPFFDVVKSEPQGIRLVRRGGGGDHRSTVEAPTAEVVPSIAGWAGLT